MKAIKYLFLLFILLLPFGSGAADFIANEFPSNERTLGSDQLLESHSLAGVVPENLIAYTVTENTPEEINGSNESNHYFHNKNTEFLYQSEFESRTKLLSVKLKNLIIPSLDTSTLIYPFHSFL